LTVDESEAIQWWLLLNWPSIRIRIDPCRCKDGSY
jgi:hypothetical protein